MFGPWWRRCRVHAKAILWLRPPEEVLLRLLAHELGLATAPPPPPAAPGWAPASDPDDTTVLPAIEPDVGAPLQTPAIPPTPTAEARQPDQDHSGTGEDSESPRPRRGPSENPLPGPGPSLLLTGGITWPS
jgi:hypothetical protein